VTGEPLIKLHGARHPLLSLMQPGKVVPNDIFMGEDFHCLIISGANTGGKTVLLKTIGLCALLVMHGLHVPAGPDSVMGVFSAVMADIGDDQSIARSLSSFSGQVIILKEMMERADGRALLLIDEIVVGTNPRQGAALAQAILEKMIKTGKSPPVGDGEYEKKLYLAAYKMLTDAGYNAVGHDRYSRVEWHMRENCLNGWPWGGILTTGAGCFMGYLQRFSYSNIENIDEYMKTVSSGKLPIQRLSESSDDEMMRREMSRLYLRLPVSKKEFMEKFNKLPEDVFPKQLKNLKEKGLIEIDDKEVRITKQGEVWKGNIAWEFAAKQPC